jgi:multiple sugar transport system permease protein
VQLFILPTMILLIVMNIFPLIYSLYLSFTNYSVISSAPPEWVGISNYTNILTDERFWHNFAVTGSFALASVALQTIVGFSLALLLRQKFRGSGLVTTLILIPMMLSPIVVATFWTLIFNPSYGIFNYLLGYTNINTAPEWLGESALAMWAIVFVDVWMWSPFVMLLCLAGLSAIPDYLYEAAAIDRADWWFQFRRITLPQVMPLLLIAVLFRTIEAFKQFDLVMGLTGGGPGDVTETVSVRLYRLAFSGTFDTGQSSALAYVVLIVIIAISNLYIRALNRARGG